ncbi:MAG: iron-sulfur cluster assembly protein [candidate division KSB1 bacterium]|nr:iron-sulfur cluster assembly protein [candidate division KSB1 bacterium]
MLDPVRLSEKEREVFQRVITVRDPEFGHTLGERGLIDEVKVLGDTAYIVYHLTVPFCPDVFALYIGSGIRKKALEVPGIVRAHVEVRGHIHAETLNRRLSELEK